jgi:hypothetical protein
LQEEFNYVIKIKDPKIVKKNFAFASSFDHFVGFLRASHF